MRRFATSAGFRLPGLQKSAAGAVEFALLAPFMATAVMLMLDFAWVFYMRLELVKAVNAATQYAYLNAQVLTSATIPTYLSNVQSVAQTTTALSSAPTVTVLFNNAANASNAGNYFCLSGYSPVVWASTGSASASCGGSIMSGRFVTITASATATSFFPADPVFGSSIALSDVAIIRIE